METITFKGSQSYFLRKADFRLDHGLNDVADKVVPATLCNIYSRLRIRFLRSDGCGCLGFSKILLFTEFRNNQTRKKLENLAESSTPNIFGDYDSPADLEKTEPSEELSLPAEDPKIPNWLLVELFKRSFAIGRF